MHEFKHITSVNTNSTVFNLFHNKVVAVTGGSAGIGAAVAECFAKEGASITIVGRNKENLNKVAKLLEGYGANVLAVKADVSKDDEAKTIIKQTVDQFGKLDVLVNNAGILRFGSIEESNVMQIYDEVMNTNLRSIINLTNLAVPYLKKTKGNVVNMSSVASTKAITNMSAYCISKAGVDHFTRCAAVEFASDGIRVNCLNPGPVLSEMLKAFDDTKTASSVNSTTVLGKASDPEEVGDLVLYLASDKAKSITGCCYNIDNGFLIK